MTQEAIEKLKRIQFNNVINQTIKKYDQSVGIYKDPEIPADLLKNMDQVATDLGGALKELNSLFSNVRLTAVDELTYAKFLMELLPQYVTIMSSDIDRLTDHEIAVAVESQASLVNPDAMRQQLVEESYAKDQTLTREQLAKQYAGIEDALIVDAYKTRLQQELNVLKSN